MKKHLISASIALSAVLFVCGIFSARIISNSAISIDGIPPFSGSAYVEINGNTPDFAQLTTDAFEKYSPLDEFGRCGTAYANICKEIMPTEERGPIGQVKPSGWQTVRYDFIDDMYLYNRCHLIGYQLSGENANRENLITGTRYMNTEGMLPFENMVAEYVISTDNHVLYRVTPIFKGSDLVAYGVQIEAMSVEDKGKGISFNVFCYNAQPGVEIDYATGESRADGTCTAQPQTGKTQKPQKERRDTGEAPDYVVNTNTMKYHLPDCDSVTDMSERNRMDFNGTREELEAKGYKPCGRCIK